MTTATDDYCLNCEGENPQLEYDNICYECYIKKYPNLDTGMKEEAEYEYSEDVLERRSWVEWYNNSLPQRKWYDEEFECDMSMGIGGIYDSEEMNFVFDNIMSNRIKELRK